MQVKIFMFLGFSWLDDTMENVMKFNDVPAMPGWVSIKENFYFQFQFPH